MRLLGVAEGWVLGSVRRRRGEVEAAQTALLDGLAWAERSRHAHARTTLDLELGLVLLERQDAKGALGRFQRAGEHAARFPLLRPAIEAGSARAQAALGQEEAARAAVAACEAAWVQDADPIHQVAWACDLGHAFVGLGDKAMARQMLQRARALPTADSHAWAQILVDRLSVSVGR